METTYHFPEDNRRLSLFLYYYDDYDYSFHFLSIRAPYLLDFPFFSCYLGHIHIKIDTPLFLML